MTAQEESQVMVATRIPRSEFVALQAFAAENDRSVAQVLRLALRELMEKKAA